MLKTSQNIFVSSIIIYSGRIFYLYKKRFLYNNKKNRFSNNNNLKLNNNGLELEYLLNTNSNKYNYLVTLENIMTSGIHYIEYKILKKNSLTNLQFGITTSHLNKSYYDNSYSINFYYDNKFKSNNIIGCLLNLNELWIRYYYNNNLYNEMTFDKKESFMWAIWLNPGDKIQINKNILF